MQFSPVLAARIFLRPSFAHQAKLKNHRYSDLRQMTSGSGSAGCITIGSGTKPRFACNDEK
jgi:hypothetical protein